MGSNQTSWAYIRPDGYVETFLRLDLPETWVPEEGYTVIPDDELPEGWQRAPEPQRPVPQTVTAWQIRRWLFLNGIRLSQIDAVIDSIQDSTQRDLVRIDWDWAPFIDRSHPMLVPLAAALGLTEAQVDQAFREAADLQNSF